MFQRFVASISLLPILVFTVGAIPNPVLHDRSACHTLGGYTIGVPPSKATIESFDCDGYHLVVLNEVIGWEKYHPVPITKARADLVVQPQDSAVVTGCLDRETGAHGRIVALVLKSSIYDDRPTVLEAWQANLDTWKFEELDRSGLTCRLLLVAR